MIFPNEIADSSLLHKISKRTGLLNACPVPLQVVAIGGIADARRYGGLLFIKGEDWMVLGGQAAGLCTRDTYPILQPVLNVVSALGGVKTAGGTSTCTPAFTCVTTSGNDVQVYGVVISCVSAIAASNNVNSFIKKAVGARRDVVGSFVSSVDTGADGSVPPSSTSWLWGGTNNASWSAIEPAPAAMDYSPAASSGPFFVGVFNCPTGLTQAELISRCKIGDHIAATAPRSEIAEDVKKAESAYLSSLGDKPYTQYVVVEASAASVRCSLGDYQKVVETKLAADFAGSVGAQAGAIGTTGSSDQTVRMIDSCSVGAPSTVWLVEGFKQVMVPVTTEPMVQVSLPLGSVPPGSSWVVVGNNGRKDVYTRSQAQAYHSNSPHSWRHYKRQPKDTPVLRKVRGVFIPWVPGIQGSSCFKGSTGNLTNAYQAYAPINTGVITKLFGTDIKAWWFGRLPGFFLDPDGKRKALADLSGYSLNLATVIGELSPLISVDISVSSTNVDGTVMTPAQQSQARASYNYGDVTTQYPYSSSDRWPGGPGAVTLAVNAHVEIRKRAAQLNKSRKGP